MKKIRDYMKTVLCLIFITNFLSAGNTPQRIVSLGPTLTEKLYLLDAGDKIVGNTIYCQKPEDAKNKQKIGTVQEHNIEKIVNLKPDLILATSLTHPKTIKKLQNLGLRVIQFPNAKNFNEICTQFIELGKLINKEKVAQKIVDKTNEQLKLIRKKTKVINQPKVFVQIGANPLFTITKDSFIHNMIQLAGGTNIAEGAKSGIYSREEVLKKNPDVIIIVTMGIVGETEKKIWQKFQSLNAVKNNRIYTIDADKICRATPVNFVQALKEIVEILHE